jgi:signal peptidase I
MARRGAAGPSDEDDDLDDAPDVEPSGPPRRRRGPHARPSVRPWSPSGKDDEEAGVEEEPPAGPLGFLHRPRRPVFFRARDSVYFEPLVALAIIVLMLVSLYAYTQNWPPVYVIESDSMQHGDTDNLGLINTGDLVLAQKVQLSQITSYVVGLQTGYSTYGEYGDVLLYYPNGVTGTPIIHRAIIFLEWDSTSTSWSAPSLGGLSCGGAASAFYNVSSSPTGCGTTDMRGSLTLNGVGWQSSQVVIDLTELPPYSGFITMGDNNYLPATSASPAVGLTDQGAGISHLVQPGWVLGVARGMMPWFGAVKLLLSGSASEVPMQSWEFLGLTLAAIVLLAMGLHYLLRAEGIEDPRRKLEDEEAEEHDDEEEDEDDEGPPREGRGRWFHPLRSWRGADEDEEDDDSPAPKTGRGGLGGRTWGGRPRPAVGRKPSPKPVPKAGARARKAHDPDDDGT